MDKLPEFRIGQGFDSHRFVAGKRLILGGIEIPYTSGLEGHSDADVLVHALIDALIGAAGLGDIGKAFPDTDSRYLGIDSCVLLKEVMDKISSLGWVVVNFDSTIIAEEPKLGTYIFGMREKLSDIIKIDAEKANIKAKTAEHLGALGRKEGIAALCSVLLVR